MAKSKFRHLFANKAVPCAAQVTARRIKMAGVAISGFGKEYVVKPRERLPFELIKKLAGS